MWRWLRWCGGRDDGGSGGGCVGSGGGGGRKAIKMWRSKKGRGESKKFSRFTRQESMNRN